ncbi:MAG TPA: co-chaperone GroES [Aquella sp.]|nr:co-chaperone GroES [Aquella sp.]
MATLKPLHDRVVVERVEAEEKTASGIVLPGAAAEKPDMGVVVAVGAGKKLDNGSTQAMSVKSGDKVLFGKYSGQVVKQDGKELLVMREDDILAIIA